MIDKSSPLPLYYQIKEDILEKIENGTFKCGDQIEGEISLMKHYGVSQITVRKAVSELVTEGVLHRIKGKGTYVTADRKRHTTSLRSFAEEMIAEGQGCGDTKVVSVKEVVNKRVNTTMNLESTCKTVRIERIRFSDGSPLGLQISYIAIPSIPFSEFECIHELKSVYKMLEKYGKRPVHVCETYRATVINNTNTKNCLEASLGDPAFFVTRKGFDEFDCILEYTESILLGSKYELITEMYHKNMQ